MTDNNRSNDFAAPVLSDYFARLTLESNILRAECELVVMGIFVYASSKEIVVWNTTFSNYEKSRGNLIDVILTDGFHFRKVFLCPRTSLEDKVLTNKLYVGKKVKLMHCSLNVDATNPEYSFIAVHELEIVGDAAIPDIDTLSPDPRCTSLRQLARNFMPMLENKITFFDIWFNNIPRWPPEEMFAQTPCDDEQFRKAVTSGPNLRDIFHEHISAPIRTFPVRPIVVRIISKGNLFPVNSERGVNCPYHSLYRIVDASGACTMAIFNEANIVYNRIQEGTLLYLAEYNVKVKDPSTLIEAEHMLHDKCKGITNYPMEIEVLPTIQNQNRISAIPIKIIDGAQEDAISPHLPLPMYKFLTQEMLTAGATGLVDVVGVVVGISRYIRLKQKKP